MKTLRARWIDRLESSAFQQTYKKLCNGQGAYCCLGVAAEILVEENLYMWNDSHTNLVTGYGETDAELDQDMADLFGLTGDAQSVLVALNDAFRLTFEEIAQVLKSGIPDNAEKETALRQAKDLARPFGKTRRHR